MKNLRGLVKKYNPISLFLRLYQVTCSPDHGMFRLMWGNSRCKFYPSCSEYALGALRQYGLLRGCVVAVRRVAKCNPWNQGGYDPVK